MRAHDKEVETVSVGEGSFRAHFPTAPPARALQSAPLPCRSTGKPSRTLPTCQPSPCRFLHVQIGGRVQPGSDSGAKGQCNIHDPQPSDYFKWCPVARCRQPASSDHTMTAVVQFLPPIHPRLDSHRALLVRPFVPLQPKPSKVRQHALLRLPGTPSLISVLKKDDVG